MTEQINPDWPIGRLKNDLLDFVIWKNLLFSNQSKFSYFPNKCVWNWSFLFLSFFFHKKEKNGEKKRPRKNVKKPLGKKMLSSHSRGSDFAPLFDD